MITQNTFWAATIGWSHNTEAYHTGSKTKFSWAYFLLTEGNKKRSLLTFLALADLVLGARIFAPAIVSFSGFAQRLRDNPRLHARTP
jgi:hypothetical protein